VRALISGCTRPVDSGSAQPHLRRARRSDPARRPRSPRQRPV